MTREERADAIWWLHHTATYSERAMKAIHNATHALSIDYDAMIAEIENIDAWNYVGKYRNYIPYLVDDLKEDVTKIIRKYINAAGEGKENDG